MHLDFTQMHPVDYPNLGSPGNFPRPCADLLLERYRHQQHKASIKTTNTNAAMPVYMRSLRTVCREKQRSWSLGTNSTPISIDFYYLVQVLLMGNSQLP